MPYRDDEEALRARVERLEDELHERDLERAENEALRRRVAELERRTADEVAASARTAGGVFVDGASGPRVTPRPAPAGGLHLSMAEIDPRDLVPPPPLIDARTMKNLVVAGGVTTLLSTILLPFFGIGELFVATECPPGVSRAYTRRYRQIRNGSKGDHSELRCVMPGGKEVLGDETASYLVSVGVGLSISLALLIGAALAGARRRRAARAEREIQV